MPTENSKAGQGANGNGKTRLLIIDGDRGFARDVSEHLGHMGYSVETAHNGREGLGLFRTGNFPVVLADLRSPDMNGVELLKNFRQADRHVSVVLTTGPEGDGSVAMPGSGDCYDLIEKPVTPEKLSVIVSRAVAWQRLARRASLFRRLSMALLASIPLWMAAGALLARTLGY